MTNIGVISDLKLRTSYGQTGNQEIGLYNSISRMNSVISVFGNPLAAAIGYVPTSLANPDLKWEVNTQFDVGLDLSVLNNRITFTADYYKKRTDDLLANLPIPGSSGFSSILINSGHSNLYSECHLPWRWALYCLWFGRKSRVRPPDIHKKMTALRLL